MTVVNHNLWAIGNVARSNWLYDVTHLDGGCMSSYNLLHNTATNTAIPTSYATRLNLRRSNSNGLDDDPDRVRDSQRGNDERRIGQVKKCYLLQT